MTKVQPETATPPAEIPELMYVHTVAKHLCCSNRKIYTLIQENELTAVRLGKRGLRVEKSSLNRYLEKNKIKSDDYFR